MLLAGCKAAVYQAGTYRATEKGYGGDLTVEVEFDRSSILSVKVTRQNETLGFGDKAIEELPKKIVELQTVEVDAISSVTLTSETIKAAVKDCIRQAKRE
jgi:fumarate reductase flavoprotein subunit